MSVYKRDPKDEFYCYDFRWSGHRFSGSTGESDKRKAQAFEKAERKRAEKGTIDRTKPLTFSAAATLYWNEMGKFHRNYIDTERSLAWLQVQIGNRTQISAITDAKVADMVAIRRGEGVSNATVNRSVIEPLRAIISRSLSVWGQSFAPPDWKQHTLREAQERIRELSGDEQARYFAALRPDYHPIINFALLSGCRMQEILDLEWRHIDWRAQMFRVTGKGDKTRQIPLSMHIEAVLKPLPRADKSVFTYESQRADNAPRGAMVAITREGLKTTHRRTCAKAGIEDFRFHDFRHTAATRMVRKTGNLKMVQKLLGHEDIATTARYSHVTSDDLLAAMNATETPTETQAEADNALKDKDEKS